jgi:hypothetical protein
MGATHELVEWFSTPILGPKNGMLETEGVYQFDTQHDMFDNFIGAIVAVTIYALAHRRTRRRSNPGSTKGVCHEDAHPQQPVPRAADGVTAHQRQGHGRRQQQDALADARDAGAEGGVGKAEQQP